MNFNDLRLNLKKIPLFSLEDVLKWFPKANRSTVKNQLKNWTAKGYLSRLKKNLYFLAEAKGEEEFFLANYLYQPSYVSLESALNYYGLIPDVPLAVTSVTRKKTQEFKNELGLFLYRSVKPALFFGWEKVGIEGRQFFLIAKPEKALFDYLYLNQRFLGESFPQEERFDFPKDFNWPEFQKYLSLVKNKRWQKIVGRLNDQSN